MKSYSKRLYRSKDNKVFLGVMGGLGEYFDVDPVLFRVIYTAFTFFSGVIPGLFGYLLMAIVMPKEHIVDYKEENTNQ